MRPIVLALVIFGVLGAGAAFSLVSGPAVTVDDSAHAVLGQRELFAALLGVLLLGFVAMGWWEGDFGG